jgi:DMSO reductase anchor subunit
MMIYHDTRRTLWHWRRTGPLFFGSIIVFVAAAAFALKNDDCTLGAFVAAVAAKLLVEISILRHVTDRELTSLKKTALLVTGQFQNLALVRLLLAVAPMGVALLLKTGELPRACALLPLGLLFTGEILERSLFFRAVDAPKMPGGLSA